jgi:hypothetical protein
MFSILVLDIWNLNLHYVEVCISILKGWLKTKDVVIKIWQMGFYFVGMFKHIAMGFTHHGHVKCHAFKLYNSRHFFEDGH